MLAATTVDNDDFQTLRVLSGKGPNIHARPSGSKWGRLQTVRFW